MTAASIFPDSEAFTNLFATNVHAKFMFAGGIDEAKEMLKLDFLTPCKQKDANDPGLGLLPDGPGCSLYARHPSLQLLAVCDRHGQVRAQSRDAAQYWLLLRRGQDQEVATEHGCSCMDEGMESGGQQRA